jgi:ribosome biogenesis GTPase / thiamine phosphate phosphatase
MILDDMSVARLQAIGLTDVMRTHLQSLPADPRAPFLLRLTEGLLAQDAEHDGLAVGDWVWAARDPHGQWWVHQRLPPLTQLARRLHDGRDKVQRAVIVSNVDTALLVMGLDHDFNLRRLERYLALARLSGIAAVVVLTKADLCGPDMAQRRLREVTALLPAGVHALALNALGDEPRRALAPWLGAGQTLVLVGSSGAGKSTLGNALLSAPVQDTGPNRRGDSRGRHTTTARSLHRLPGGACLIDTPGLRTLRLDVDADTLDGVFDDIARLAAGCRFRDCRHQGEPGCAVSGQTAPERLRNFQKLQRELQRDTMSALERQALRNQWKARHQAGRARERAKREPG